LKLSILGLEKRRDCTVVTLELSDGLLMPSITLIFLVILIHRNASMQTEDNKDVRERYLELVWRLSEFASSP